MSARPLVVLFDLDGTAVMFQGTPPGPGRRSLALAMRELHSIEGATEGLRVAGGTDRALVRSMLVRFGIADAEDAIDRVLTAYLAHLEAVLATLRYHPVGDVAGSVAELRRQGAVVGVATGNIRAGAHLKLASAELSSVFDLALGGYGCDAELRADILRVGVARCIAASSGASDGVRAASDGAGASAGVDVVVVGDTEHDVLAARAIGARVVGVAVTAAARAELEASGADVIVEACGDALVRAVLSFSEEPTRSTGAV